MCFERQGLGQGRMRQFSPRHTQIQTLSLALSHSHTHIWGVVRPFDKSTGLLVCIFSANTYSWTHIQGSFQFSHHPVLCPHLSPSLSLSVSPSLSLCLSIRLSCSLSLSLSFSPKAAHGPLQGGVSVEFSLVLSIICSMTAVSVFSSG